MDAKLGTFLFVTVQGDAAMGFWTMECYSSSSIVWGEEKFATIEDCENAILKKYSVRQLGSTEIFVTDAFKGVSFAATQWDDVHLHFAINNAGAAAPRECKFLIEGRDNIEYSQFLVEPRDFATLLRQHQPLGYPEAAKLLAPAKGRNGRSMAERQTYLKCMHRAVRAMIRDAPIPRSTDPNYEALLVETDPLFDFERSLRACLQKITT